jgi:hypothetical protein
MKYIKNIAFTRVIKVRGVPREFNFRKKYLGEEPVYDIDSTDERGNRYYLTARKKGEEWVVPEHAMPPGLEEGSTHFTVIIDEYEAAES